MDRVMLLRHLRQAERHIAEGGRHIARQEYLVAELDGDGRDATEARRLLETFRIVQAQHIQHRHRILRELAE